MARLASGAAGSLEAVLAVVAVAVGNNELNDASTNLRINTNVRMKRSIRKFVHIRIFVGNLI